MAIDRQEICSKNGNRLTSGHADRMATRRPGSRQLDGDKKTWEQAVGWRQEDLGAGSRMATRRPGSRQLDGDKKTWEQAVGWRQEDLGAGKS